MYHTKCSFPLQELFETAYIKLLVGKLPRDFILYTLTISRSPESVKPIRVNISRKLFGITVLHKSKWDEVKYYSGIFDIRNSSVDDNNY